MKGVPGVLGEYIKKMESAKNRKAIMPQIDCFGLPTPLKIIFSWDITVSRAYETFEAKSLHRNPLQLSPGPTVVRTSILFGS